MYRNLKAAMVKQNISTKDLAKLLGITERGVRSRINGSIGWKWTEVTKIKHSFFNNYDIEDLFATEKSRAS